MATPFEALCDLVASDSSVIVTGAGISLGLKQKDDPTKTLPSWENLLRAILADSTASLGPDDLRDCEALLGPPTQPVHERPSAIDLITTASILRRADPTTYDDALRRNTTPAPGQVSTIHSLLIEMAPRGIVTFNYDDAHEVAGGVDVLLPDDDAEFVQRVRDRFPDPPFLLKAHGDVGSPRDLVLSAESYRELLFEKPSYRAFVHTLLADFQLLFVGFGLSDPDFDMFMETMIGEFGSPLHTHVAIMGPDTTPRQVARLRQRYGIEILKLDAWGDRDVILRSSMETAGPRLKATIDDCFSSDNACRSDAHRRLERLGPCGRRTASAELTRRLEAYERDVSSTASWSTSEAAYSLGVVDPVGNRDVLMSLMDRTTSADVAGRTLTVLRPVLVPTDEARLRGWRDRFDATPPTGKNPGRIVLYLDYLVSYVPAKFNSDPP